LAEQLPVFSTETAGAKRAPVLRRVCAAVVALISLPLLLIWGLTLRPTPLGGPTSYIMVTGVSMYPTLEDGDLAVVRKRDAYGPQDIIAFRVPEGTVIHRIVGGNGRDGYITLGDNKDHVDEWHPTDDDVLGSMWFSVPGLGRVLAVLQQPAMMAALTGGLVLAVMQIPGGNAAKKDKRTRGGAPSRSAPRRSRRPVTGPGSTLSTALAVALALSVVLGAGTYYLYRLPVQETVAVEETRYVQQGTFNYLVFLSPSQLYHDLVLGPYAPDEGAAESPTVFSELARSAQITYTYNVTGQDLADVQGEVAALLEIRADDAWTKTVRLQDPTPFAGAWATAHLSIDFAEVISLTQTIAEEIDYHPQGYELAVTPVVTVRGTDVRGEFIDTFSPAFTMRLDQGRITFDDDLYQEEERAILTTTVQDAAWDLWGYRIPVRTVRSVALGLTIACLAASAGLGLAILLRRKAPWPESLFQDRDVLVVPVESAQMTAAHRISLSRLEDLVALAERDGKVILCQETEEDESVFTVDGGTSVYEYRTHLPPGA